LYLKSVLITEVASLEGDNIVVFYYLMASEICPGNRGGLIRAWPSCGEKGGYGCKLT
jgi:hypothetical protein